MKNPLNLPPNSTMSNIHIRHATRSDLGLMLPLMEQLGYPATLSELEMRFDHFTASPESCVAVAVLEDKIVGWVAWTESPLFVSDATRLRIEGLVVHKDYHSQGIGQKLMSYVEERARTQSPCIIELTSGIQRTKSHDFYEKLGYSVGSEKIYFRKKV